VRRLVPLARAGAGELTVLFNARYVDEASRAPLRGDLVLIDATLAQRGDIGKMPGWFHPYPAWAMAELLDGGDAPEAEPVVGEGCKIGPGAHLLPRVRIGARVSIRDR